MNIVNIKPSTLEENTRLASIQIFHGHDWEVWVHQHRTYFNDLSMLSMYTSFRLLPYLVVLIILYYLVLLLKSCLSFGISLYSKMGGTPFQDNHNCMIPDISSWRKIIMLRHLWVKGPVLKDATSENEWTCTVLTRAKHSYPGPHKWNATDLEAPVSGPNRPTRRW